MDKKELDLILEKHKLWLDYHPDGERAKLEGAKLEWANIEVQRLR